MTRYVKVLRAAPYLARVLHSPRLARTFGDAIDLATRVGLSIGRRRAGAFELEWLDEPDARFDELWSAAQTAYTIVGRRDAQWLTWRWMATPAGRGQIAALVDRATGRLCAYAIVRSVDGIAHVGATCSACRARWAAARAVIGRVARMTARRACRSDTSVRRASPHCSRRTAFARASRRGTSTWPPATR